MQLRGDRDREWVESFLLERTVPVRLATSTPDGGLWMLSLWYEYDPDESALHLATSASARVVDYLEADDRVAFEVSTNELP